MQSLNCLDAIGSIGGDTATEAGGESRDPSAKSIFQSNEDALSEEIVSECSLVIGGAWVDWKLNGRFNEPPTDTADMA